jgi:hypothetical protein
VKELRPIKACHDCGASYTVDDWQHLVSARLLWPIDTRICRCGSELKLDLTALETIDHALPVDREKFRAFAQSIREKNMPPGPTPQPHQVTEAERCKVCGQYIPNSNCCPKPPAPQEEPRATQQSGDVLVTFDAEAVTLLYLHVPLRPRAHVVPPRENAEHRAERLRGILAGAQGLLDTLASALRSAEPGKEPRA